MVTAFVAIATVFLVAIPQPKRKKLKSDGEENTYWEDFREGFTYVLRWRGLLIVMLMATAINFLLAPASALTPLLVSDYFGGGAIELGWFEAIFNGRVIGGGILLGIWLWFQEAHCHSDVRPDRPWHWHGAGGLGSSRWLQLGSGWDVAGRDYGAYYEWLAGGHLPDSGGPCHARPRVYVNWKFGQWYGSDWFDFCWSTGRPCGYPNLIFSRRGGLCANGRVGLYQSQPNGDRRRWKTPLFGGFGGLAKA